MIRSTTARVHWLASFCLLALLALLAPAVHGKIIQSPDATTHADLVRTRHSMNQATIVEAYRDKGSRDPKWDAQAEAFLMAVSDYWGGPLPGRPSRDAETVVAMGDAAVQRGCDDPMVLYCLGRLGNDVQRDRDRRALDDRYIIESVQGLVDRDYPAIRIFNAARHALDLIGHSDDKQAQAEQLRQRIRMAAPRSLEQTAAPGHQRIVIAWICEYLDDLEGEELDRMRQAIEAAANADQWSRHVVLGNLHVELAWAARGGGWASTVDEAGWKGFHEHLQIARQHLTAAWKLDPSRPEPAANMITVAMGASQNPAAEMRQWFDRAVTAQFDYIPAYSSLLWGLRPRWHGSHEVMWSFVLECAETERFETEVPWQLIKALWDIRDDHDGSVEPWRQRDAYTHVARVLDGYARRPEQARNQRYQRTVRLTFAWACERWPEAKAVLEQIDGDFHASALRRMDASAQQIAGDIYAHTSRWADQIEHGTQLARAGQMAEALAVYETLEQMNIEPAALARWIGHRAQTLRWRLAFDRGDEVALLPGRDLIGFQPINGKWTVDEHGRIIGTSDRHGLGLALFGRFGTAWEMAGRIEPVESRYSFRDPAVIIGGWQNNRPTGVILDPQDQQVAVGRFSNSRMIDIQAQVPNDGFDFRVRFSHGLVNVWINDQQVVRQQRIDAFDHEDDNRPGIGGYYWWSGQSLAFSNLTLRSLAPVAAPPAAPAAKPGPPPAPR